MIRNRYSEYAINDCVARLHEIAFRDNLPRKAANTAFMACEIINQLRQEIRESEHGANDTHRDRAV